MTLAVVYSRAEHGIDAPSVSVEVHLANGLPALSIVGLPETAVKESKDRVRAAIQNCQFEFPSRRITVNLAPADIPKDGGRFDLPIALGILKASGQLKGDLLERMECLGELGLSGEIRPVRGVLPFALQTAKSGRNLIVPMENAAEASLASNLDVLAAKHLLEVCAHLNRQKPISPFIRSDELDLSAEILDLADVQGQPRAKRALEIAATGQHNLFMIGPPGAGKTMLASRLPGILPPMTEHEATETAAITSISHQGFDVRRWGQRPFRTPHHTASGVALVGGGSVPKPGEISLAHNGVLFLDELTEFDRRVLEVLREPLETGIICISRAARQAEFPAKFQFIAAMNPCPQGYDCDLKEACRCTLEQQRRHRSSVSAPLLDRIDIHIDVPRVPQEALRAGNRLKETSSAEIRARVMDSRERQLLRQGKCNAQLNNQEIEAHCKISDGDHALLDAAMARFKLSARAYHRILRVARSIADLDQSTAISKSHLSEAISYRTLDRFL